MQRRWSLTEGKFKSVPEEELVQMVIVAVLEFVGSLAPGEDEYELVRQTPKSAQFFWAMRLVESEVNNGGFEQYFWNSSCTLVEVALEAYRAIGAETYVDLLQRALDIAGGTPWKLRRDRFGGDWRAYKRDCAQSWDMLDDEFYAAKGGSPESGGDDIALHERKTEYIRRHAKAICSA